MLEDSIRIDGPTPGIFEGPSGSLLKSPLGGIRTGGFGSGLITLYSGNKAYSPWSLCAWLALSLTDQPFGQTVIPLGEIETPEDIELHSPSGHLPAIRHGETVVWESLAIFEYLAETFPSAQLWPRDVKARAQARSICAEMHAGFPLLQKKLPFDMRCVNDDVDLDHDLEIEVSRITEIWRECLAGFGANDLPFLFGEISLADAIFAPTVVRFTSYEVPLDPICKAYCDAVWEWPSLVQWKHAALNEEWVKEEFEL